MRIDEWNNADVALYDFFNKTFWNKISAQDQTFYQEVDKLRAKVRSLEKECIHSLETNRDTGELEIRLNEHTIPEMSRYLCEKMTLKEESYISYLRKKYNLKFKDYNERLRNWFYEKLNKTRLDL